MNRHSNVIPIFRGDAMHPQAQACLACDVRGSALFGALDKEALDHIHSFIEARDLAPDQAVFGRGDEGLAVFTIRSGVVRFERVTEGGDRRIFRLAGRGDLIGQEALLGGGYHDDAIASTAVQLCRIPVSLVEDLGSLQGPLMRELMTRWQKALTEAENWVADLAMGPARRRLLALVLKLSEHSDGQDLAWLPRREEIGAMLDMTVETASRLISSLKREGILEIISSRTVRINQARLMESIQLLDGA